jgi:hypothetical protein
MNTYPSTTIAELENPSNAELIRQYENINQSFWNDFSLILNTELQQLINFQKQYPGATSFIKAKTINSNDNNITPSGKNESIMQNVLVRNLKVGNYIQAIYDMIELYRLSLASETSAPVITTKKSSATSFIVYKVAVRKLLITSVKYFGPSASGSVLLALYMFSDPDRYIPISAVMAIIQNLASNTEKNPIVALYYYAHCTANGRAAAISKGLISQEMQYNSDEMAYINSNGKSIYDLLTVVPGINPDPMIRALLASDFNLNMGNNTRALDFLWLFLDSLVALDKIYTDSRKLSTVPINKIKLKDKMIYAGDKSSVNLEVLPWLVVRKYLPEFYYLPLVKAYFNFDVKDNVYFLAYAYISSMYRNYFYCDYYNNALTLYKSLTEVYQVQTDPQNPYSKIYLDIIANPYYIDPDVSKVSSIVLPYKDLSLDQRYFEIYTDN